MRSLALAAVVLAAACRSPRPTPPPPAPIAPASAPPAATEVAPDDAGSAAIAPAPPDEDDAGAPAAAFETWQIEDLEVVAALPTGAREPRPVVVGVHGSRDRPEAACQRWRRALAGYPFIVCPRGVPYRGGLAWGSPADVAVRIDRALAALRARHGALVADGPVVYAGWSLGATLGPRVVALRPRVFDPVVLVEIGHTRIDVRASAASLRTARAAHTIVACATKKCATFARRLGPPAVFVDAGIGRGHLFDERMARAVGAAIETSVASDPRWAGLSAALLSRSSDAGADEVLPPVDDEPELAP